MEEPWFLVNVEGVILKEECFLLTERSKQERHAPGVLSLPGGKVEQMGVSDRILEETLRREIREEVGIEVADRMEYVESKFFVAAGNHPVIDVVFLCRWRSGEPVIHDPDEVASAAWMTLDEIRAAPQIPSWTRQSIELASVLVEVIRKRGS